MPKESSLLPSDHDTSNEMQDIKPHTGQGARESALAELKVEKLDSSEEEYIDDEEMEDDDESEDDNRSENDELAEFDWLEAINGFVTCTGLPLEGSAERKVGHCNGKLIRRDRIRANFYHEMEEPSRETSLVAFDLFDRYGRLRGEFKDHEIRKGSGVWSDELDNGDILLIEEVKIDKEYRRRGLGKRIVAALLEKARGKPANFSQLSGLPSSARVICELK